MNNKYYSSTSSVLDKDDSSVFVKPKVDSLLENEANETKEKTQEKLSVFVPQADFVLGLADLTGNTNNIFKLELSHLNDLLQVR